MRLYITLCKTNIVISDLSKGTFQIEGNDGYSRQYKCSPLFMLFLVKLSTIYLPYKQLICIARYIVNVNCHVTSSGMKFDDSTLNYLDKL